MKQMPPSDHPIPVIDWPSNAGGYGKVLVDAKDPRFLEPLVRASDFGICGESFYARDDGANWPYNTKISGSLSAIWLRQGIAHKLSRVNENLRSLQVELFVWDGYRSIETQRGLWKFFEAQADREMPGASPAERREFVLNYVSDPSRFVRSDSTTWPAHTTGAAVDLTLRDSMTGSLLDMGAAFDEMSPVSHSDALERARLRGDIGPEHEGLRNRRILHWAMRTEGFVNYPLEFWHFDWGNQMYVHNLAIQSGVGPAAAWYGYVDSP